MQAIPSKIAEIAGHKCPRCGGKGLYESELRAWVCIECNTVYQLGRRKA